MNTASLHIQSDVNAWELYSLDEAVQFTCLDALNFLRFLFSASAARVLIGEYISGRAELNIKLFGPICDNAITDGMQLRVAEEEPPRILPDGARYEYTARHSTEWTLKRAEVELLLPSEEDKEEFVTRLKELGATVVGLNKIKNALKV